MKIEGLLFAAGTFFYALSAVIYWIFAEEPVGTVALAFTAGLAFLVGYYLLFTARRIDPRPEDRPTAEIVEGAGELGHFSPYSWWPLAVAVGAALSFLGIVIGWWMFIIGAIAGGLAVIGLVFEYYRGEQVH
ncbi:MAG TPA: cytochrome c oxidase subunit 4 [Actinomycetes bacterium]